MTLSKRQIKILVILKSEQDWVTSDQLASILKTNRRTIQADMKAILVELTDQLEIATNRRTGYRLLRLSSQLRQSLAQEITVNQVYATMDLRASTLLTFLFLNDQFVSMQQLADTFYLSKTAVAESIKLVARWIDRNRGMSLTISKRFGIQLVAEESARQLLLSLVSTESVFDNAGIATELKTQFKAYIITVKQRLRSELVKRQYVLAGDDFTRFTRLLAYNMMRKSQGHVIDHYDTPALQAPLVTNLLATLARDTGVHFDPVDEAFLTAHFFEFNPLTISQDPNSTISVQLRRFEKCIIDFLHLPVNSLFKDNVFIKAHLERMVKRVEVGHTIMNHFAHETVSMHPLEMYLVRRYVPICFGVRPSLAELAYVVVYLAQALEKFRHSIKVCLVSNRPASIISSLEHNIQADLNGRVATIQVLPTYLFNRHLDFAPIDVFLTTEETVVFADSRFKYLSNTNDTQAYQLTMASVRKDLEQLTLAKRSKIKRTYFPVDNQLQVTKQIKQFSDIIPNKRTTIGFPISGEVYLYCATAGHDETKIMQYQLKKPLIIQQRRISTVFSVVFDHGKSYQAILAFFDTLTEIINQSL